MSMALKQTGLRTFEATSRQNDKVLFTDKYVVSPDGHLLANSSKPSDLEPPLTWVYDRR